ncbi:hypothetical protein CFC21_074444 [Triticum aestivum]|uniref:Uncharacterized protein n=2 Tax=Triticum aestivum TaxID=4565 RepID=A0A3B6LWK2_WHEAT|nr:uncharacterized protein LOC119312494 [Triticum dicoccoides]XP_044391243.1 uncharacterized protein LOC123113967 [Triticum aestivum]KAF7068705.1 hypothetical protein CFC21_074444 [Triticum aestivum]
MTAMLRSALGSALRPPAPASRFFRKGVSGSRDATRRKLSSSGRDGSNNSTPADLFGDGSSKTWRRPEVVFITAAALSMATYTYIVNGKTVLGYQREVMENQDEVKPEKDNAI